MAGGHVMAVADGHGSERCFRSARGAELAVASALAVLGRYLDLSHAGARPTDRVPLARDLVDSWRAAVQRDLEESPIGSLPSDAQMDGDDEFMPYGTTMLAAAASDDIVVVAQLGDGESLLASTAQGPIRPPLRDPELAADTTTSLALPDAEDRIRIAFVHLSERPVDLVLLASDGYSNAFADDAAFGQVATDLLAWLSQRDPQWVAQELPVWLAQSAAVSGDDASLGLLYRWPVPASS
jgi:serine/threonine protein phosphatase PrpC